VCLKGTHPDPFCSRLGLGHPLLSAPPTQSTHRNSLNQLSKQLNRPNQAKRDEVDPSDRKRAAEDKEESDEEEEDSRSRSVGKGRVKAKGSAVHNLLVGKKKKRTKI
jgi:hypothetical protein